MAIIANNIIKIAYVACLSFVKYILTHPDLRLVKINVQAPNPLVLLRIVNYSSSYV